MPLFLNQVPPVPSYLSPALRVVKQPAPPAPGALNQDAGTPVLDVTPPQTQQLQAIVGNDSAGPIAGVRVQFWVRAFSTTDASSLYLDSVGGPQGMVFPAGGSGRTVQPGVEAFELNWRPASTDQQIVDLFGGTVPAVGEMHCCVLGNVFGQGDGAQVPSSPNGPVLDIAGNRRHAQRNMTIKTYAAGVALTFVMHAANPDPEREQDVLLQIEELPIRKLQPIELRELDGLAPWLRRSRKRFEGDVVPGLEVRLGDERLPLRIAKKPLKDLQLEIGDASGPQLKLTLGPDEPQLMRLNASLPKEELVLRILDITQRQGRRTVGGARVLALTVPDELLEEEQRGQVGSRG